MIRFSISVPDKQYEYLIECHEESGLSIAELVRIALDRMRRERPNVKNHNRNPSL